MNKRRYKRQWLNPKEGIANVVTKLSRANDTEYSGTIEIMDCNRVVRLDMDFWTPKMKKDKLKKLDLLLKQLTEYRQLMVDAELTKY